MLERKNKDPRMQCVWYNIIMMTNDKKVVQIPASNRRFVVIEVNPKFGGPYTDESKAYFDPVYATDRQILFDYLCSLTNDEWNYRTIPDTAATSDQAVSSFDPFDAFFYAMLNDPVKYIGTLLGVNEYNPDKGGYVQKDAMFRSFRRYVEDELSASSRVFHDPSSESFWKRFRKTFPNLRETKKSSGVDGVRVRGIVLPPVHDLRKQFRDTHKSRQLFKDTEALEQEQTTS